MKAPHKNPDADASPCPRAESLELFERDLAYCFRNRLLLREALTHRSLLNEIAEKGRRDNERLEFLGDAVLGFLVAEWVMEAFPEEREGELTRMRSDLVKEQRLCEVSRKLGVGAHLCLGRGEERMGGRTKPSVLANAYEAIVGAIYLDGGLEAARDFLRRQFGPFLTEAEGEKRTFSDPKTRVQELLFSLFHSLPIYEVREQTGPDHDRTFIVTLSLEGLVLSTGRGKSKKEAEQDSAGQFLRKLERNPLSLL